MGNKEIIAEGNKYVMNTYKRNDMAFVRGAGARVWDADGKEYIDFLGGIAVNSLGYGNENLINAIKGQCESILHSSNLFWVEPQVKLARLLCENSFGDKVFFCNSGTEANEAAIKLARKYSMSKYGEKRYEVVSMINSFHGRTMGALSATGQEKYHRNFKPMLPGFKFCRFNDLGDFKNTLDDKVCAVMIEPIQGEGGVNPADSEFLAGVRKICSENDIILIFDEVQCGVGRSGSLFAYQNLNIAPDVMTLAKGLAGGVPIGAVVADEKFSSVLVPGDHGSTFGGNHLACAAGCTVIEELKTGVLGNVQSISNYLINKLQGLKEKTGCIKHVKGMGLMLGVKLSVDSGIIAEECLENGLIVNSLSNNLLRLVPPLVINQKDVDDAMDILKNVLMKHKS